jgi:hypothetical protein
VASRYAPHLEKCMGIGRIARNSSRIASRRMKALDDDVYVQNPPSAYTASPSFGSPRLTPQCGTSLTCA